VYTEIGEGKGPGHDVVVGVHVEPPVFRHVQTSPQIDRLGEPPLFVGIKTGIIEGIVKPEIPGDIEIHIIAEVSGEFLLILNGIPGLLRLLFTLLGTELQTEGEVGIGQPAQLGQPLVVIPGIPVDLYPVLIGHVRINRGAEINPHPLHGSPPPDTDGLQVHGVGDQVIRGGQTQIVDQLHLFEGIGSRGVLHILNLHLQIIVERKGDIPGGTPSGITVDTPVKNGIVFHPPCAIGLHLLPEPEFGISEIGIVAEADRWGEFVPDSLDPRLGIPGNEHPVNVGRGPQTVGVLVTALQPGNGVGSHMGEPPHPVTESFIRDITLLDMAEIPLFAVAETRAHVDVPEQIKARQRNGQVVLDPVLPVREEILVQNFLLLGGDGVTHIGRIAETKLLVPFGRPLAVFEFQGIDLGHVKGELRHG